ncbi:GNAT family N-acetyltransferase [Undibacterium parvum]|uniref:GNAT family N-acetyltransferase n=1 Tax=Undibacterium parvum TaxID=401471 RepID=A0A3Q9BP34_9BURK|nr:GNAT family N-acetyltransferase [Undibacterium parvum]AZP11302.1 GNAT family N-acetyltransferase [Undibacterium parvum]
MQLPTTIRAFKAEEWRIHKQLRLAALVEAPYAYGSTLEAEQLRSDALWQERLQLACATDREHVFLAEVGAEPAGLLWAKFASDAPQVVELFQMWVRPVARGHGVGAALLQSAIEWASQAGARCVNLGVAVGDTPAVKLYQRAGFSFVGDAHAMRPGSSIMAKNMQLHLPAQLPVNTF